MKAVYDTPMRLSLVVPTYNERESIEPFLARLLAAAERLPLESEILVVDDDSPDGTAAAAGAALGSRGRVIVRRGQRGLATAVLTGFREARGEILGVLDADGSHPPERLPELLAPLLSEEADIAVASRYVPGGGTPDWSRARLVLSRAANLLARIVTPVRDATSGYFLLRRSVVADAPLSPAGFKIALEILVKGRYAACREVPYVFRDRQAGRSKMSPATCAGFLWQLGRLAAWKARRGNGRLRSGERRIRAGAAAPPTAPAPLDRPEIRSPG